MGWKRRKAILVFYGTILYKSLELSAIWLDAQMGTGYSVKKRRRKRLRLNIKSELHSMHSVVGIVKVEVDTIQNQKRCRGRAPMSRSLNSPAPACTGCLAGASYRSASRPSRTALPVKERKRRGRCLKERRRDGKRRKSDSLNTRRLGVKVAKHASFRGWQQINSV